LNVKTSRDAGQTWGTSQRLTLSPFLNLSELVKNNPAALSDGGWAVPIYQEFLAKFPEILWLNETAGGGLSWSKTRIFGGRSALQPALVPQSQSAAMVLCRDSSAMRKIRLSRSTDVGENWSPPETLTLPNPDSGLDALRLFDGRILLAFNDSSTGRDNLSLALSEDGGLNWTRRVILENEPGAEFSYPYLIQTRDGRLHLVYTWKRKAIKHAVFNLAWLDAQAKMGPGGAK
jgi:predicted neuraminidase